MAPAKVFAHLAILFAVNTVTSTNAKLYTTITNVIADEVYQKAGYTETDFVLKWKAEGIAIFWALYKFYSNVAKHFTTSRGATEVIVASTGDKACSYIYGMAERLKNEKLLEDHQKQSNIIVVYTLNYAVEKKLAVQEYLAFKDALNELKKVATHYGSPISVVEKQFRPVANNSTLADYDYQNGDTMTMTAEQIAQHKAIIDLHNAVAINEDDTIKEKDFANHIKDKLTRLVVDVVLGSEVQQELNDSNRLLWAIPRAQIRIMAKAILDRRRRNQYDYDEFLVLCFDNPSGMNESGIWTIDNQFKYPVHCIISRVWNKPLVNSINLLDNPVFYVLDITYQGVRLFDKLSDIISSSQDKDLQEDVQMAKLSRIGGIIWFIDWGGRRMEAYGLRQ